MKTIHKYPIAILDEQQIKMPSDAKILCAAIQDGRPFIWAEVVTENRQNPRTIEVFGTGNPIDTRHRVYIGTVQMPPFVWHVYELVE